jgi:hypothetical protein
MPQNELKGLRKIKKLAVRKVGTKMTLLMCFLCCAAIAQSVLRPDTGWMTEESGLRLGRGEKLFLSAQHL